MCFSVLVVRLNIIIRAGIDVVRVFIKIIRTLPSPALKLMVTSHQLNGSYLERRNKLTEYFSIYRSGKSCEFF